MVNFEENGVFISSEDVFSIGKFFLMKWNAFLYNLYMLNHIFDYFVDYA